MDSGRGLGGLGEEWGPQPAGPGPRPARSGHGGGPWDPAAHLGALRVAGAGPPQHRRSGAPPPAQALAALRHGAGPRHGAGGPAASTSGRGRRGAGAEAPPGAMRAGLRGASAPLSGAGAGAGRRGSSSKAGGDRGRPGTGRAGSPGGGKGGGGGSPGTKTRKKKRAASAARRKAGDARPPVPPSGAGDALTERAASPKDPLGSCSNSSAGTLYGFGQEDSLDGSGRDDEDAPREADEAVDEAVDEAPEPAVATDANPDKVYYLVPQAMPGLPPTVAFGLSCEELAGLGLEPRTAPKLFLKYGGVNTNVIKTAFRIAGFRKCVGDHFNATWTGTKKGEEYEQLKPFQRTNHFPGTWNLGRKDRLYRHLSRTRRAFGAPYDILPKAFALPGDYEELVTDWAQHPENWYILKPKASSRGRGIRMVKSLADVHKKKGAGSVRECIVQRYIRDPYLVDGYKFDMRVYVCVTSFDPLKVYVHPEGLVRFATEKYSQSSNSLKTKCAHLTNYSINGKNENYVKNTDADDEASGSKWSLRGFEEYLRARGVPWEHVWAQVRDIVAKTVIAVEASVNTTFKMHVPHKTNCYEIYGFDVVLDTSLRAWLLEVNTGPALHTPSPLDRKIKMKVVTDMLNLVGFQAPNKAKLKKREEELRFARLTGLTKLPDELSKPKRRDVREADRANYAHTPLEKLPHVVREYEAEYQRRKDWEQVFPCREDPTRYHEFFDVQRYDNILVKRWLLTKDGPRSRSRPATAQSRRG